MLLRTRLHTSNGIDAGIGATDPVFTVALPRSILSVLPTDALIGCRPPLSNNTKQPPQRL